MKKMIFFLFPAVMAVSWPFYASGVLDTAVREITPAQGAKAQSLAEDQPAPETAEDRTGSGATAHPCDVTFVLYDDAGGYDGETVTVRMTEVTNTSFYEDIVDVNGETTCTVTAPTVYDIAFDGVSAGYEIVGADGSSEIKVQTTNEGHKTVELYIIRAGEALSTAENEDVPAVAEEADEEGGAIAAAAEAEEIEASEIPEKGTGTEAEDAQAPDGASEGGMPADADEEAMNVFISFVEAALPMYADDSPFRDTVLRLYDDDRYADYFSNAFGDELWDGLDPFHRFICIESYARFLNEPEHTLSADDYRQYCALTVEEMIRVTDSEDSQAILGALDSLIDWQVAYINAYGEPYNFPVETEYLELAESDGAAEAGEEEEDVRTQSKTIWDGTLDALSKNLVTVLIFIGLALAIFILYRRHRKFNIDE